MIVGRKERITVTIDGDLLRRVDAVAEEREESRSAVIELMLGNEIEEQEAFLRKMENPVTRILMETLTSSPRLMERIAKLTGDELSREQARELKGAIKKQAGRGRMRRRAERAGGGASATEGASG